jgi:DNA-binding HxlR family transcriptional regulator
MEVLGDRWSLVVLRDIVFGGWTHYRELLNNSMEGIASNILVNRLAKLVEAGPITRHPDPAHKQKVDYRLTEAAIQLVPVLVEIGRWGARWMPTTRELRMRAELLADGGPKMTEELMDELRTRQLNGASGATDSVLARLDAAYAEAIGGPMHAQC